MNCYIKFVNRYDSTIVAVASQERRNETLFTVDFCQMIELSDLSYCMLERIGRSRSEGCSSCELNTIKTGVVTPSHYYWKMLQNYKLITVQVNSISLNYFYLSIALNFV